MRNHIPQDDIHASDIASMPLNKLPYEKIQLEDGVIFATYSSLIASRISKSRRTRLDQLVQWCGGKDFDGCILFGSTCSSLYCDISMLYITCAHFVK